MKNICLAAVMSFICGPTISQNTNSDWTVRFPGRAEICKICTDDAEQRFQSEKRRHDAAIQWIEGEMGNISDWMSKMSFKEPYFPDGRENTVKIHKKDKSNKGSWDTTFGEFSAEGGIELQFETFMETASEKQPPYARLDLLNNSSTLAHELFHAVQFASGDRTDEEWHAEGTAAAVADAWTQKNFGLQYNKDEDYSESLTTPTDPYALAEFFYETGRLIDGANPVSYLADLYETSPSDGAQGVIWLDRFLKTRGGGLAEFYAMVIARFATNRGKFKADAKDAGINLLTELSAGEENSEESIRKSIPKLAARYSDVSPKLSGDWSAIPEEDRLYIASLRLESAQRPEDLRLIVDGDIYRSDQTHLLTFYGESGTLKQPWAVRIANIAEQAQTSRSQDTSLVLEIQKAALEVPDCVAASQSVALRWQTNLVSAEASKALADSNGILATNGSVDAQNVFTAPANAGQVEFSLKVARLDGGHKTVALGATEVSAGDCMIRMIAGPALVTYSDSGDYAEFSDPTTGTAMYLKTNDLAVWQGGWMNVPAKGKAMILGAMKRNMDPFVGGHLEAISAETGGDEFLMHRLPKVFSQRFSWKKLRRAKFNGKSTKRVPIACLDGANGCSSVDFSMDGNPVKVLLNSQGRPDQVVFDGEAIRFEYGGVKIRKPSNW